MHPTERSQVFALKDVSSVKKESKYTTAPERRLLQRMDPTLKEKGEFLIQGKAGMHKHKQDGKKVMSSPR